MAIFDKALEDCVVDLVHGEQAVQGADSHLMWREALGVWVHGLAHYPFDALCQERQLARVVGR